MLLHVFTTMIDFVGNVLTYPLTNPPATPEPDKIVDIKPFDPPPEVTTGVGRIIGFISWGVFGLAFAGVLFCAGRGALAWKNGGEVFVPGLVTPMIACIIASSGSAVLALIIK